MLKEENKDSDVRYKNPSEYEKYVRKHFECMKADGYQVKISERLYYRATKDKKIEQWLEKNLTMLPYCMKSLSDIITVTGGHIVSCICHMNNYNNISTEIRAADQFSERGALYSKTVNQSIIRTTNVSEIEEQIKYNSIFWTPEAESAGFKAKA
ncbi:MAG: hypothetical protein K2N44_04215 [Lachnospiraceae bacterium]|nr:hypothetical protein [Lachnospiraceae bacterium]